MGNVGGANCKAVARGSRKRREVAVGADFFGQHPSSSRKQVDGFRGPGRYFRGVLLHDVASLLKGDNRLHGLGGHASILDESLVGGCLSLADEG